MRRRKQVRDEKGNLVDGVVVDVRESIERFSDVYLDDGTILKTKMSVTEAVRIDEQRDADGNPIYLVKSQNLVSVYDCPKQQNQT